jgi:hypothetical protein
MPVMQHKGKWFRIWAEEVYELQPDANQAHPAGPLDANAPTSFQTTGRFVGVWEEVGSGPVITGGTTHGDARKAIEEAIREVIRVNCSTGR